MDVSNPAKWRETARVRTGRAPYCIAISADGAKAYVTNQQSDSVSVIDTVSAQVKTNIAVGAYPEGVAFDPSKRLAYTVNWMDDNITVIDAATDTVIGTIDGSANNRSFGQFISDE